MVKYFYLILASCSVCVVSVEGTHMQYAVGIISTSVPFTIEAASEVRIDIPKELGKVIKCMEFAEGEHIKKFSFYQEAEYVRPPHSDAEPRITIFIPKVSRVIAFLSGDGELVTNNMTGDLKLWLQGGGDFEANASADAPIHVDVSLLSKGCVVYTGDYCGFVDVSNSDSDGECRGPLYQSVALMNDCPELPHGYYDVTGFAKFSGEVFNMAFASRLESNVLVPFKELRKIAFFKRRYDDACRAGGVFEEGVAPGIPHLAASTYLRMFN